jgi:hypothetical protein
MNHNGEKVNDSGRRRKQGKIQYLILLFFCAAALLFASCPNPADSSSPEEEEEEELGPEGAIRISGAADLAKIGMDEDFPADGEYELAADIELVNWTPLCTEEAPFSGSLNGNGKTIRITGFSSSALKHSGLFAYIKGGAARAGVKNLNIAFNAGSLTLNGGSNQYIAALAGYAVHADLDSITVTGSLTVNKTAGNALYAAGIAAYLEQSTLNNCVSSAALNVGSSRGAFSGGIAGYGNAGIVITGCRAGGALTVNAAGTEASAGGIIGSIRDTGKDSLVSLCTVTGNVSLSKPEGAAGAYNMFYCGGVIGYAGNGTAGDGTGGVRILQSRYEGAAVYCKTSYPYSGGIIGYSYTGSEVSQCYSTGTVTAEGSNLPYSGGVAGYASRGALIVNSYSTAAVKAAASSRQALAGGIAGAAAAGALISKCYAAGPVWAQTGGTADDGGSVGVPKAANAGGITGALYSGGGPAPKVEYCAALNDTVGGSGAAYNVYRITKNVDGTLLSNIAWKDMTLTGGSGSDGTPDGQDGLDNTTRQPEEETAVNTLQWDIAGVWLISAGAYPVLRWQ